MTAAIGLSVKSGWAAAVLLTGPVSSPSVADSRRIELSDPSVPDARQPYHAGIGMARDRGPDLTRLLRSVRQFGSRSVGGLLQRYEATGQQLAGAGVVVGSLADPEQIVNAHIRIHALEGQLFRTVVTDALGRGAVTYLVWRERDLYGLAAKHLRRTDQDLRGTATALGRGVEGAWRAEQKAATVAAWMALALHSELRKQ